MTNENKEKVEEIIETMATFHDETNNKINIIRDSFESNTQEEEQMLFDADFMFDEAIEYLGNVARILKELIK